MEVTVKKLRKTAIVYKIAPSGNSKLAGHKIVSVASVAKCWRQKRFRDGFVLSQSTCHLVCLFVCYWAGSYNFAEYWKYFKARFDGLHAVGYNSAESKPIWVKFAVL